MNCPLCLQIMYCNSEIHTLDNLGTTRMDLHCQNISCPERTQLSKNIYYGTHMGVVCPKNQQWICDHYHFPIFHQNKWFALEGGPSSGLAQDKFTQSLKRTTLKILYENVPTVRLTPTGRKRFLVKPFLWKDALSIPFVPISTHNDMHDKVWKLFNRMNNLIVFS